LKRYTIASDELQAAIRTKGAELCLLRPNPGQDLLWGGDNTVWGRQAPNLFPVVGGLKDDQLVHHGQAYTMPKHGFARDREWTLTRLTAHSVTLRLRDDAQTRAQYPFAFSLSLTARIDGPALRMQYDLHNPGEEVLLASLGAHPAFRWPLLPGIPKEAHWLEFEKPEGETLPALDTFGLITPQPRPNPLQGRHLPLKDDLFARDALIFQPVRSRAVRYSAPRAPIVEVSWDGFPQLGVWSKPGAEFLCLEPWRGYPSPAGFQGEFRDKPGIFLVSPGATVSASYTVRILPSDMA
jgi:galactose mutarotase-like enzyme